MTHDSIVEAEKACNRFLECVEKYQQSNLANKYVAEPYDRIWPGTKVTGALRCASLDLSRALAEMRGRG